MCKTETEIHTPWDVMQISKCGQKYADMNHTRCEANGNIQR